MLDRGEPKMSYESLLKRLNENNDIPQGSEDQFISSIKKQINSFRPYKMQEGECIRKIVLNCRIGNVIIND
jgi:hypothetical protein